MKEKKTMIALVLFLLGIFMGAIDSGIVSPAREIIQNGFGVERSIGTWMITIYTLSYAISMPIVSKMGDRYGHKRIYTFGIAIFGLGSLLCGLSNFFGTFEIFLAARVIQAIGAGGIIPIATTVIGQSFPEGKRGMALGLVGGVYGVANILGPTLGSAILDLSGTVNWGWIFFINVPISISILVLSRYMQESGRKAVLPLDFKGAVVAAGVIGTLMYALTNTDFFHLGTSLRSAKVYPFLILFVLLIPFLILFESRAKDPILNIKYFKNKQMIVIFALAFIVGIGMMGMVFVPQFAENVLKIKAGSGGYLVTLLAVFAGVASPFSGKLIDKKGSRFVMMIGFMFTLAGTLFLGYVATNTLSFPSVFIGLALMGLGVGFTMGAPLNYLVLQAVPREEGAAALATMSLIRSIGVAISPSFMIGFIVDAARKLQPQLMEVMQKAMPSGAGASSMGAAGGKGGEAFQTLQNADVTTVIDQLKSILGKMVPEKVQPVISQSIEKLRDVLENTFQQTINKGYTHMFTAAAVIAAIGIIAAIFLKAHKAQQIMNNEKTMGEADIQP